MDKMILSEETMATRRNNASSYVTNGLQKTNVLPVRTDLYTGVLTEEDALIDPSIMQARKEEETSIPFEAQIVWPNVMVFIIFHVCLIYSLYLLAIGTIPFHHFLILYAYTLFCNFGITAGAHRLWAHRGYKANLPLRTLLILMQTLAVQNSVYEWVRDHRVHHKFTETNADPHNIKRGFFFAHVGWLLCKKHPDVIVKGKSVDLSDLESDPLIMWQHKYYPYLAVLGVLVAPSMLFKWIAPQYSWFHTILGGTIGRYTFGLNLAWLVNSYAHMFGNKPYDKFMDATDSKFVSFWALGEGWHNYHHVFPWDYKTSELGLYRLNITTGFIDFFSKLGWAYDLKTVPKEMVQARVLRTGDDSHPVWGWGDKDVPKEHIQMTLRINKGSRNIL